MNILLLAGVTGEEVEGPSVRVPTGSYKVIKSGSHDSIQISFNGSDPMPLSPVIVLGTYSTLKVKAKKAEKLTLRLQSN